MTEDDLRMHSDITRKIKGFASKQLCFVSTNYYIYGLGQVI